MANEPNYSSNPSKDEPKKEKVRVIPLEYIDEFPGHPFKVLDDESIEKQIDNYYDQMGTLVERSASTSGDTDLYDREIKKLCDKIEALRETLKTEQSNL